MFINDGDNDKYNNDDSSGMDSGQTFVVDTKH